VDGVDGNGRSPGARVSEQAEGERTDEGAQKRKSVPRTPPDDSTSCLSLQARAASQIAVSLAVGSCVRRWPNDRPSMDFQAQSSSLPQLWMRVKVVPHLPGVASSDSASRRSEPSSSSLSSSSSRDSSATLN
jgi:hypothetical protein